MRPLNVLFINCTQKPSPEISNTEALWHGVAERYQRKGCRTRQLRSIDFQRGLPPTEPDIASAGFSPLFEQSLKADILIVGVAVPRLSQYQALIEALQRACQHRLASETGQLPFYNKVLGVVQLKEANAKTDWIAQICQDFSLLGCHNPPQNSVTWSQAMDSDENFLAAEGQFTRQVNREARILVENTVAIATLLHQHPLRTHLLAASREAQAIAATHTVNSATLLTPKTVYPSESPLPEGISSRHLTQRIWTVMQEGIRRGFQFQVLSLEDRIYRAERNGQGFIYKIYPGHFSFRRQYQDYEFEQSKAHKLQLMRQAGLPVPISYGTFKSFQDIPLESLSFPLVAKPNSGSLSQNVFPNLHTVEQLQHAAMVIESSGGVIKLESHIAGQDYRVLVIHHQYAGCVERRPANVTGDGKHTILELFHIRNQEPGRADRDEAHTTLHQLVFDQTSRQHLDRAGYTLETVLPQGEIFYLQKKITASLGADYIDCTDHLHPSIVQQCVAFSRQFSTLTLGFDIITTDISRPLLETGGAFNEYNFLPYVDLHEHCNIGIQRSVSRLIWDHIETHASQLLTSDFDVF